MSRNTRSGLKTAGIWILRALAALVIAGVLLSTTDSNQWWIRAWDFPRLQILFAMLIIAGLLWIFDRHWRPWFPLALVALSAYQAYRIYPYSPIAATQVARADAETLATAQCFSVLSLNVLQDNREYDRTIDLIERIDADIVLLMETDQAWADAVQPALSGYPEVLSQPLDNKYGLMFASRLPMRDAAIRDLAQKDTPSVMATIGLGKSEFRLVGLHPRPPQPGQDTEERDAELVVAAREARGAKMPVIAIGDFNDVAWSDTTRLFMQIGQFIDPRIGRGTYATFPADMTWLGWPLDHLFVTDEFLIDKMQVLGPVGSDHRPILARMCLDWDRARARNEEAEDATSEDMRDADTVMQEFEEDTAKDRVEGE